MQNRKPNHICKFSGCRKEYYACDDCDKKLSWRAIGCCFEHARAYQDEVLAARAGLLTNEDRREIWNPNRIEEVESGAETELDNNSEPTSMQSELQHSGEEDTIIADDESTLDLRRA